MQTESANPQLHLLARVDDALRVSDQVLKTSAFGCKERFRAAHVELFGAAAMRPPPRPPPTTAPPPPPPPPPPLLLPASSASSGAAGWPSPCVPSPATLLAHAHSSSDGASTTPPAQPATPSTAGPFSAACVRRTASSGGAAGHSAAVTPPPHAAQQQQQQHLCRSSTMPAVLGRSPLGSDLRPLHWDALQPRTLQAAGETVWTGPALGCLHLEALNGVLAEKLNLFVRQHPASAAGGAAGGALGGGGGGVAARAAAAARPCAGRLLDANTCNNILIKFKDKSPDQMRAALETMDTRTLTYTTVVQCLGVLSKTASVDAVRAFVGRHEPGALGPAEAFVHALSAPPDARLRLEALRTYHYMVEDFPRRLADAQAVGNACARLRRCAAWRRLLHQLLAAGNSLNAARPGCRDAPGFRLSSLPRFCDMRTADKHWSLLDVVVEALEQDCPRHVNELVALEPLLACARDVDLRVLAQEETELERALERSARFVEGLRQAASAGGGEEERAGGGECSGAEGAAAAPPSGGAASPPPRRATVTASCSAISSGDSSSGVAAQACGGSGGTPGAQRALLLATWSAAHDEWEASKHALFEARTKARAGVRAAASWHCEPVAGPDWEVVNCRAFFTCLHQFLTAVRDSARKVRGLVDKLERQMEAVGGCSPNSAAPAPAPAVAVAGTPSTVRAAPPAQLSLSRRGSLSAMCAAEPMGPPCDAGVSLQPEPHTPQAVTMIDLRRCGGGAGCGSATPQLQSHPLAVSVWRSSPASHARAEPPSPASSASSDDSFTAGISRARELAARLHPSIGPMRLLADASASEGG
ncbi:hypothetical protein FOA52_014759 [Chlamydomonas sp. UWO 241]|nr:hypothetical protein FOA52_014759 [Chlamydomonas sp. UWO 241]